MKKLIALLTIVSGIFLANAQSALWQGGTGLSTSTIGDLLVGTSSTLRYSRLPVGSSGLILQASSTSPFRMSWVSTTTLGLLGGTGVATRIPFYSDPSTFTTDSHFYFNSASSTLHVHKISGDATDGLFVVTESGLTIGVLGAGNSLNVTWYGNHNFDTATANTIAGFGASKTLQSLSTATYPDLTELSYVKGVTSAIQTQLNAKATLASFSATKPLNYNSGTGVFSTDFSTSSVNSYSAQQTFVTASATGMTATNLYSTDLKTTNASTTGLTVSGQGFLATTSVAGDLTVGGTIVPRVVGYTSSTTITIDVRTTDIATTTLNATTTFANPTGTPYNGQMFEIWGRATTSQGVSWGTLFASSTDLNNVATVASGTTRWLFEYRKDSGKYELVGLLKTFPN